ncbi:MAG: hypothetical protein H7Y13_16925 [Sphingobacteriaceae bacterium]|nr:hypothetical protein [Sphingobacteriaceae bacterium]
MSILKTSHPFALQLLMTEEIYSISADELPSLPSLQKTEAVIAGAQELPVKEVVSTEEPSYFEYLGENNKYILVLVNEPVHPFIEPKELETLVNILKAKNQELKDVAVLNIRKYPNATFAALKNFFACNSIIFFGINPTQFNIPGIQSNQIAVHESTKILATYSIAEMLNNVDKKRVFWNEMKKI